MNMPLKLTRSREPFLVADCYSHAPLQLKATLGVVEGVVAVIEWVFYPKSQEPPGLAREIVKVFKDADSRISSPTHTLSSNEALAQLRAGLEGLNFKVERGKKAGEKLTVPVLFGRNGKVEKAFDADAYHESAAFVLEVEAGRAVSNNQFLKDLFQACLMVGTEYLGIGVRRIYRAGGSTGKDFEAVVTFFDTLYSSNRLRLPLKGVLIIGY